MEMLAAVRTLLPAELRIDQSGLTNAEELRLRLGKRPTALISGAEREIGTTSVTEAALKIILERASDASLYTHTEELRNGYVCYRGLRIGVCGEAVVRGGRVTGFRSFSSLSIRIPREMRGILRDVPERIMAHGTGGILLLSPPGGGKTTALRELVRCISDGGVRVGVADERGELSCGGLDLGRCTDVITNASKAEGALMLLRTMNPRFIAMDELASPEDMAAAELIYGCGVKLIAAAHAADREELMKRELFRPALKKGMFGTLVTIRNHNGTRSYEVSKAE